MSRTESPSVYLHGTRVNSASMSVRSVVDSESRHSLLLRDSTSDIRKGEIHILDDVMSRIAALEEKLNYIAIKEAEGINLANEAARRVQLSVSSLEKGLLSFEALASSDLIAAEGIFGGLLEKEMADRCKAQRDMTKAIQHGTAALEKSQRHAEGSLDKELADMNSKVSDMTIAIEKKLEGMQSEMQAAVGGVMDRMAAIQRAREATGDNIIQTMADTYTVLSAEIAQERKERMESHKHLERILLEATSRKWTKV